MRRDETNNNEVEYYTKNKETAYILAIMFGFWAWLYTYKRDATKFWISVGNILIFLIFSFILKWYSLLILIQFWTWAIVDTHKKDESFFDFYPKSQ